jgi:hypothetical protein
MFQNLKNSIGRAGRTMAVTVKREPCPKCQHIGRDTRADNLARYPDGHGYCYSCGHWEAPTLQNRIECAIMKQGEAQNNELNYPLDAQAYIPVEAAAWLHNYGITAKEVKDNGIEWSESRKLLLFPIKDAEGCILAWQGRNFRFKNIPIAQDIDGIPLEYGHKIVLEGPKYYTQGRIKDILHIIKPAYGVDNNDVIILVEGIVDAIKVGRMYPTAPLLGSRVPLGLIQRLSTRFNEVGIWLDPDKKVEAVKSTLRASQLMKAFVVLSLRDPKEYDETSIIALVRQGSEETIDKPN